MLYAFLELFGLHGIGILNVHEHFRRETRESAEVYFFARSQGVADLEVAGIGNADYVAGKCLVDDILFLCHECGRCGESHCLAAADVAVGCVALEASGAYFHECYAAAVIGIHIGVDLEHETAE